MAWSTMLLRLVCESPRGTSSEGRDTIYEIDSNDGWLWHGVLCC